MSNEPEWERITDPEKLFHLQKAGWEIEVKGFSEWIHWGGVFWQSSWTFRARQPKPKMKQVTMLCYYSALSIVWRTEDYEAPASWIRQPNLDLIAEVPE